MVKAPNILCMFVVISEIRAGMFHQELAHFPQKNDFDLKDLRPRTANDPTCWKVQQLLGLGDHRYCMIWDHKIKNGHIRNEKQQH